MVGAQNVQKTLKKNPLPAWSGSARVRDWIFVSLAVCLPVAAALAGSYLLGNEVLHSQETQTQQTRMEEVRSQSRLLAENVWDQIDSLKMKTIAFETTHKNLNSDIKAYAQIQFNPNGTIQGIRNFQKNAAWTNPPQGYESQIEAAARKVSLDQIRRAGTSIVEVPRAPGQGTNLIGVAFESNRQVSIAIADPSDVFSRFGRWTTRREAGNLRGYLIGSTGHVIVHSERVYSGADFSGSDVYLQALRSLFREERVSGVATYRAVDLRTVTTAYVRLANLPYAVVVERVTHPAGFGSESGFMRQLLIPAFLLLTAALVISLFSILGIQKYFERFRPLPEAVEAFPIAAAMQRITASAAERASESHDLRELRNRLKDTVEERLGGSAAEPQNFAEGESERTVPPPSTDPN